MAYPYPTAQNSGPAYQEHYPQAQSPQPSYQAHAQPEYTSAHPNFYASTEETPAKHTQPQVNAISGTQVVHLDSATPSKSRKSHIVFWLSLIAGVLWLAPAATLLYFNLAGRVIGASAWCPDQQCGVITYYQNLQGDAGQNTYSRAVAASKDDHNLLGGLQVAAKAMEVWFIAMAASLVYTISRIMARSPGGLPLGHLLAHIEFADMLNLGNLSLYKSASRRGAYTIDETRTRRRRLILFVLGVVLLCIFSNLVGPMTAVLMVPSLSWIERAQVEGPRFDQMRSSFSPSNGNGEDGKFSFCNDTQLSDGQYSCLGAFYGSSLDTLTEQALNFFDQTLLIEGDVYPSSYTATIENMFPFSFNSSEKQQGLKKNIKVWATNRQAIRELSQDFNKIAPIIRGQAPLTEHYKDVNNSLALVLQRDAPIIGSDIYGSWGDLTQIKVDGSREVRCISEYYSPPDNEIWYSKCFRLGSGWSSSSTLTRFYIDPGVAGNVTVWSYWSDKTAYFQGRSLTDWDSCFQNVPETILIDAAAVSSCDWDALFSQPFPADLGSMPSSAFIFEFWNSELTNPQVLTYELHPTAGRARYTVDVTQIYPQFPPVIVEQLPSDSESLPIVLNADWMLATWGFDVGSTVPSIDSSDASPASSAAGKLKLTLNEMFNVTNTTDTIAYTYYSGRFYQVALTAALQTLSLVTYDTTTGQISGSQEAFHPNLMTNVRLQVWKWGMDSRTSKLAVAVIGLACLIIITRTIALLVDRQPKPSTIGIIASLMEHMPQGELQHIAHNKREDAGMVRFRVQEVHEDKLVFERR